MNEQSGPDAHSDAPTVLYNGACPVCGTEIRKYQQRCSRAGVAVNWSDISHDPAVLQPLGLEVEAVKERLHAIGTDGRIHVGIAAFLAIWPRVPGYAWAARVIGLPVIRQCAEIVYDRLLAPALYAWNRRKGR